MAPQISYPGVYIQEIPSGIKTIRTVQTSVAGVVGSFPQGPIKVAKHIRNWRAFTQTYGGLNKKHLASYSVKQFFDNGGTSIWIVRTEAQNTVNAPALLQGLRVLDKVKSFNILFIPENHQMETPAASTVHSEAIAIAAQHRAMYILDPPILKGSKASATMWLSWLSKQKTIRHPNVVVYTPALRVRYPANTRRTCLIPASGTMARLWARMDKSKGVWKAAAGTEANLRNVQSLQYRMTDQDMQRLNIKGLNPLKLLPSNKIISWGARTFSNNSEWRYVPVRRLTLLIESSVHHGTQWVAFEPNDEPLWANIRQSVGNFLNRLFRKGAFQGARPEEAYFVRCGPDTMSAHDQLIGTVNIMIGFAPLKPAEFVVLTIQQHTQALGSS